MSTAEKKAIAHVVDVLGNVIGRDQPIMRLEKAHDMISLFDSILFKSNEYVFFDPFCKAGEILFSTAFRACKEIGNSEKRLMNVDEVFNEVFKSNKYFALAPDERHHRLSLRTFLGNTHSHNDEFNKIIKNGNYVSEIDGTLNQELFRQEINSMIEFIKKSSGDKKIIAVGNPPYQEEDGGAQKSAKPIYHWFVEQLIETPEISEILLVIPARWFAGGKGLDKFRQSMIDSGNIKKIKHFEKSGDVFPTVDIDGGICYLNWDRSHNGNPLFITDRDEKVIDLSLYDIIPDDPGAHDILETIRDKWDGLYISEMAWARKPFGLATNYFTQNSSAKSGIKCLGRNKTVSFIRKSDIPQKSEYINHWKVCIPGAYGGKKGQRRKTLPAKAIFLVEPGTIVTETYMVIDVFSNKKEAENLISLLSTDFSRYLLGLRKITQHIPRERWAFVPYLDANEAWDDEKINKFFGFSAEQVKHIQRKVKEWA